MDLHLWGRPPWSRARARASVLRLPGPLSKRARMWWPNHGPGVTNCRRSRADLVVFLASDRAGNTTGSDYRIDGGFVTTL